MPLSFVGDYPTRTRVVTGLTSFDLAVAGSLKRKELGLPLRCGYHIFSSKTGIGKTTIALSLASMISGATKRNMKVLAIDTFDRQRAEDVIKYGGADGECTFLFEGDPVLQVESLYSAYCKPDTAVSILDSVNMAMSKASIEGKSGDSNMGRDAFFMSNHIRKMYHETVHAKTEKVFILTNIAYPNLGFVGNHTKGGVTPNANTSIHLNLTPGKVGAKTIEFPEGKLVKVKATKNNFGVTNGEANLFVVGEVGIHRGLTAVYDCILYGLATEGRKISLDSVPIASIKDMLENYTNEELFHPFIAALDAVKDDLIFGRKKKIKPVQTETIEKEGEELYGEEMD